MLCNLLSHRWRWQLSIKIFNSVGIAVALKLQFFASYPVLAQPVIYVVGETSLTYYAVDEGTDSGYAAGMDALFLTHLLEELGYKVRLDVLPWSRALQFAKETPNTLIHSIARNPQREEYFHWIEAYTQLNYGLYSFGWLAFFFGFVLFPDADIPSYVRKPSTFGEIFTGLWLLVMGARDKSGTVKDVV